MLLVCILAGSFGLSGCSMRATIPSVNSVQSPMPVITSQPPSPSPDLTKVHKNSSELLAESLKLIDPFAVTLAHRTVNTLTVTNVSEVFTQVVDAHGNLFFQDSAGGQTISMESDFYVKIAGSPKWELSSSLPTEGNFVLDRTLGLLQGNKFDNQKLGVTLIKNLKKKDTQKINSKNVLSFEYQVEIDGKYLSNVVIWVDAESSRPLMLIATADAGIDMFAGEKLKLERVFDFDPKIRITRPD
jgi:hypothetical protein